MLKAQKKKPTKNVLVYLSSMIHLLTVVDMDDPGALSVFIPSLLLPSLHHSRYHGRAGGD